MAKRFLDSKLFDKVWFRKLSPRYKLLWLYILGTCDYAGIWDVDQELTDFRLGIDPPIDLSDFLDKMKDKIFEFDKGEKWYLIDYVKVQCGELKMDYNPHKPIIKRLYDQKIHTHFQVLPKAWLSLVEKEKEHNSNSINSNSNNSTNSTTGKKVKKRNYNKGTIFKVPLEKEIKEYMKEINFNDSDTMAVKFFNHYEMKGWMVGRTKMKDWKAAVRYWKSHNQTNNEISDKDYKLELERRFGE